MPLLNNKDLNLEIIQPIAYKLAMSMRLGLTNARPHRGLDWVALLGDASGNIVWIFDHFFADACWSYLADMPECLECITFINLLKSHIYQPSNRRYVTVLNQILAEFYIAINYHQAMLDTRQPNWLHPTDLTVLQTNRNILVFTERYVERLSPDSDNKDIINAQILVSRQFDILCQTHLNLADYFYFCYLNESVRKLITIMNRLDCLFLA